MVWKDVLMHVISVAQKLEIAKKKIACRDMVFDANEKYVKAIEAYQEISKQAMCDHPSDMITVETVTTKCKKCGYEWMD